MTVHDMPKVDCHCHVFDPAAFPYDPASPYHPAGQEIAPAAQMAHAFAAHGVAHALLVQPNSGYGEDNRCLLDAIARSGGRWKGIAVVPPGTSGDELAALKAQGIVGAAVNLTFHPPGHYDGYGPLFDRLARLGMHLQVQVEGPQLTGILPLLLDSGASLVIDHCGRPDVAAGLDQPGFRALLELGRSGRAAVKLSGQVKFSAQAHPFADARPYVAALIDAFGPERCLWGSDWPFLRAPSRVDYGPLLDLFESLVPDRALQQQILWDNPRRIFGF
ncbi:amidohydrolase [Poseidonocella sp. HB161398]|uniref:amidohydrolase family protein n=1 Tax=Poseidonocella sp. HB161398 TaxID=2320855 RepID=UPI001109340B|nr:amidohydrolase family protein [Poseidonocella sp. HB161398]